MLDHDLTVDVYAIEVTSCPPRISTLAKEKKPFMTIQYHQSHLPAQTTSCQASEAILTARSLAKDLDNHITPS
jgi:hypothetical protein